MKITDLVVRRYAGGGAEVQIVEVLTDAGISGTGFLSTGASTGELFARVLRDRLKRLVVGEDPLLHDLLWRRMYEDAIGRRGSLGFVLNCIAAVDFALWDLKGKLLNAPLWAVLGGRRERIPTYANAAHHLPVDQLAAKAVEYVQRGHKALKIRGTRSFVTLKEATARVQAVREAVGPAIKIMVDVNGSWDVDTAIQQLKAWERFDVYWLEEPVPPEDIPGYVAIKQRAGDTYIVGGEQHVGVMEFRQLIENQAVDFVQPNAQLTGGITDWLRIHALATSYNLPVSPWDLQAVHAHFACALPNVKWIEYFMPDNPLLEFQSQLFKGPKFEEVVDDEGVFLLPPEAPGLGIELDESVARRSLVAE